MCVCVFSLNKISFLLNYWNDTCIPWGRSNGVVAYVLGCDVLVNEIEPQSCYFIHFWIK